ncbi:uncharacterized protein LOC107263645 [Cephus cinctus]|uniref:Uncharacterized protein LOC107263645 n=1 Tax=Cephus cinctus TaxID=211228 RepID=A0AAJ7BI47_CEPCN|nr:uncharacterized protein LOC107263645 [Cephus cinctus]
MSMQSSTRQIESGLQLLTRLSNRPSLKGLCNVLFPDGLLSKETVEITGNVSSGKTFLMTQLLAQCILPLEYSKVNIGLGIGVIFINTDHHFMVTKLVDLMCNYIKSAFQSNNQKLPSNEEMDVIINSSLKCLNIINCYNNSQFLLTLKTLETTLLENYNIALVAIDSISAFYWENRDEGGVWAMDLYITNLLELLHKSVTQFNIAVIYTRPSNFVSKVQDPSEKGLKLTMKNINYKINVHRDEKSENHLCTIRTATNKTDINYLITECGLTWLKESKVINEDKEN